MDNSRMMIFVLLSALVIPPVVRGFGFCPEKCVCEELKTTCDNAGLDSMPNTLNPMTEIIAYNYNDIKNVDASLAFLPKLLKIDLRHNSISSLRDRSFARQSNLKKLDLSSNKIESFTNETFFNLRELRYLSLRDNKLQEIPAGAFRYCSKLEELDLSGNSIVKVHPEAFQDLPNLRILKLSGNELTQVPSESFALIPDLSELYISHNPDLGPQIPSLAFNSFLRLNILDLADSGISRFAPDAFRGLSTLQTLKLEANPLEEIPTDALAHLPALSYLDLSSCDFINIKSGAFRYNGKLENLLISKNVYLEIAEPDAFDNLGLLEKLSLTQNPHLKYISQDAFGSAGLPALKFLDLSRNALTSVSEQLVARWSELWGLDLSGNPWRCDCELVPLAEFLRRRAADEQIGFGEEDEESLDELSNRSLRTVEGKCSAPSALADLFLSDLRREMLDCDSDLNEVRQIYTEVGQTSNRVEDDLRQIKEETTPEEDPYARTNALAVIISVSIVSAIIACLFLLLLYVKCRYKVQDYLKEWRWRRHERALARKSAAPHHYVYQTGATVSRSSPLTTAPMMGAGASPYGGGYEYHSSLSSSSTSGGASGNSGAGNITTGTMFHQTSSSSNQHQPVLSSSTIYESPKVRHQQQFYNTGFRSPVQQQHSTNTGFQSPVQHSTNTGFGIGNIISNPASPALRHVDYMKPVLSNNDEHYYYVSTLHSNRLPNNHTQVNNTGTVGGNFPITGKRIPVTEL